MNRNDIVEMFDSRRLAYDRQDAQALAYDYADDCTVESPSGGLHHGRDAARAVVQHVFDTLDVKLHEESLIIDGDSVAQVVTIEGKDVGALLGMAPTGKPFRVPGVFLYELRDGKIVKERRIYDFTSLLIQTGLMKAKPAN
jgi:predicted ester cyclase